MTKSGIFLLLFLLLVPAATAATISISPDAIESGDTVTVNVNDLPDGAAFSLGIRGEFAATPNSTFAFTARDLTLPFSLTSGEVNAYTKGTNWTHLSAELPDGGSVSMNYTAKNGEVLISQPRNIPSGTLSLVALDGKAAATSIIADLTVLGTKQGPNDGTISFAIEGVERGTATVTVYIDGAEALSRAITIGGGAPTPTATTTQSSGGDGGSSGPGGSSGGSTGPAPTETTGPATVTSADGKASLTGTDVAGAGLQPLPFQGTIIPGSSTAGNAYAVTPANRTFDPAAVLSFPLPSAGATATIARLENGFWSPVPSKAEGDRITTAVSRAGSYVLLVPAEVPTLTATATTTTAATTPAAAPMAPLLPVIAFATLMLGWKRRG
jgi:hypothetical protein